MENEKLKVTSASPAMITKHRFKQLKKELRNDYLIKLNDFRDFVLRKQPEYNDPDALNRIHRTWYGYQADLILTELLEAYKKELLTTKS